MIECPCCFKDTLDEESGRCTRCGIQMLSGKRDEVFVKRSTRITHYTQEPWETDYTRTKDDKK
jgi:hypothetical protein